MDHTILGRDSAESETLPRLFRVLTSLLLACVVGCAHIDLKSPEPGFDRPRAHLRDVGFFAQTEHHCGPAALATVLQYSGVNATPEALAAQVYVPGRKGSLQAEVAAAARRSGRVAYQIAGREDAIFRELLSGHPVLVLQNLGLALAPQWHYAVVVGFDRNAATLTLRSGTARRHVVSRSAFSTSWLGAGAWGLVILKPGELPAQVHENKYAHAVAPLERLNQWGAAKQAWEAALTVLPQSLVVRIGAANARYALGDRSGAAQMLESAVTQHPAAAEAHNNLAHVLGDLGQSQRALRHAHRAVALGGNNVATFQQTLKELKDRSSTGAQ